MSLVPSTTLLQLFTSLKTRPLCMVTGRQEPNQLISPYINPIYTIASQYLFRRRTLHLWMHLGNKWTHFLFWKNIYNFNLSSACIFSSSKVVEIFLSLKSSRDIFCLLVGILLYKKSQKLIFKYDFSRILEVPQYCKPVWQVGIKKLFNRSEISESTPY